MAGKKLSTTVSTENEVSVNTPVDVVDIDLSVVAKKKFRIDGDNNKIIELNTSDLSILNRIKESLQKLNDLTSEASQVAVDTDSTEEGLEQMSQALTEIDSKMRELIDYIFDYPVSAVCADSGSMYDPFNGSFRWEHIMDKLTKLYENNLKSEYKKMQARISKHTGKYTR